MAPTQRPTTVHSLFNKIRELERQALRQTLPPRAFRVPRNLDGSEMPLPTNVNALPIRSRLSPDSPAYAASVRRRLPVLDQAAVKPRAFTPQSNRVISELVGNPVRGGMLKPVAEPGQLMNRAAARRPERMSLMLRQIIHRIVASRRIPALFDSHNRIPEVIRVDVSDDLRHASVLVIPPGANDNKGKARRLRRWEKRLDSAKGEVRKIVGETIRNRGPPVIEFRVGDDDHLVELGLLDLTDGAALDEDEPAAAQGRGRSAEQHGVGAIS